VEDNEAGHQELLVARNNERYGKVCGRIQHLSEEQELSGGTSWQANAKLYL